MGVWTFFLDTLRLFSTPCLRFFTPTQQLPNLFSPPTLPLRWRRHAVSPRALIAQLAATVLCVHREEVRPSVWLGSSTVVVPRPSLETN